MREYRRARHRAYAEGATRGRLQENAPALASAEQDVIGAQVVVKLLERRTPSRHHRWNVAYSTAAAATPTSLPNAAPTGRVKRESHGRGGSSIAAQYHIRPCRD